MGMASIEGRSHAIDSTQAHRRGETALWAAYLLLAVAGSLSLSTWNQRGPDSPVFVSIVGCMVSVSYLATAYLLSNRLVISRSPALALLASTYLLCGLAAGVYTVTYPGVAPEWWRHGMLTARWFWALWHAAAACGIVGFVALDDEWMNRQRAVVPLISPREVAARMALRDAGAFIRGPFLFAAFAVGASAVWLWRAPSALASIFGTSDLPPAATTVLLVLDITAIVLLLFALRRDNLVRNWLLLAAGASLFDVAAMSWSAGPFTIGWYFSQACSLVAAVVLPIVLVGDLRARLLSSGAPEPVDPSLLDPATGALNAKGFTFYFSRMAQIAAEDRATLTVAVAEVDDAERGYSLLRRLFRSSDVIGRVGDMEFAVVFIPGSDAREPWLRDRLNTESRRLGAARGVKARIGVGTFDPRRPRLVEDLLKESLRGARAALRGEPGASDSLAVGPNV
jgi:hypothetical protein